MDNIGNNTTMQTNGADNGQRRRLHGLYTVVFLVSLLLFIACSLLQIIDNRNNAQNACSLMLDQVKELIVENERGLQQITDTLKDEYIIRANMVADHFEHNWHTYETADDFNDLLNLLQVDEIHVFDKTGTIINGSTPEYYGYTLDSGEQMAFFKPMLTDRTLSMCQDVTPNTAEGKPMMYAMVWTHSQDLLVQVGVTPERLFEWMRSSDISKIISRLPLIDGMSIYVVDDAEGVVVAASDDEMLGYRLTPEDRKDGNLVEGVRHQKTAEFQGHKRYISYECLGKYNALVSYKIGVANKTLPMSMLEFALILTAAFVVLVMVTRRYTDYMEEQGRQLMASNIAKTDFLRRMSHDIRTPLNGIRGVINIADHFPDDVEKQTECRGKVMQASGFLLELVNNVLNMNKLESGEMKPENKPFDLIDLLMESVSIVRMQGEERAINFVVNGSDHRYRHLIGSPLYLKQVLQNIGGNAVKYTDIGGTITFSSEELGVENGRVLIRFTCADTGRGMSKEFIAHAFEPFSQENTGARTNYTGTGLGLAITKQMVELMGGTVTLESELNVGTTISVTIPFEIDSEYIEPQKDAASAAEMPLDGVRVLLVEDNELNIEIAQFLLEKNGMTVQTVYNGQEAVDAFKASAPGTFDVILMDVMMPVMDGLTAAREIRALPHPDAKTVPIFAMTANAFQEDVQHSMDAGMQEHLSKPIQETELVAAIRRHVKK